MIADTSGRTAVLSIGRLYCDLLFTGLQAMPRLGRERFADALTLAAGGGAFIAAAHLASLGRPTALVARAGTDPLSLALADELATSGVDLRFLEHAADAGPQVTVVMVQEGERAFLSRRAGAARPQTLAAALDWPQARHLHIAEYATLAEIPDLVRDAKARGLTVSLDPSWDDALIRDPRLLAACAGVDIFLPNTEEAAAITATDDLDAALDRLAQHFPLVALKRGGDGARLASGAARWQRTAPHVPVVDTTGAGDAFNAGFIDAWLAGAAPEACLSAGVEAGSVSVQAAGGASATLTTTTARRRVGAL